MKMKLRFPITLAALAVGLLPLTPAHGQEKGRAYFDADIGGTIMPDTDLKDFFGPVASGSEVQFDPGLRLGFRGGYGVTDWFAAEIETGVLGNSIRSISGATEDDASLSNIPILFNARLQLSQFDKLTPYFGVGVGCSIAVLDADDIVIGGGRLTGTMSETVFAYQGFAGLRYRINDNMGLSLEYRYFATMGPEWDADVIYGPAGSDSIEFGRIQYHVLSVAFQFRF